MESAVANLANLSNALANCSGEACDGIKFDFDRELVGKILMVVVPLFFGMIGILGLAGNSLVVVVVAANPEMRSTTNILIINLAVADLLFIVFCIPFTATDFVMPWPFGNIWCKIVQYLIIVTAYASVYTLVLMSLDRFLAVVHPIASMSWRTKDHAVLAICIAWAVILIFSTPALMIHGEIRYVFQVNDVAENLTACRILPQYEWSHFQTVAWFTRQRRKPTREKTSHQAHSRRCRCLCGLLVPHTGDIGDQVCGEVPAYAGDVNTADYQSHSRLYQQLC
ncbi:allatostatin-A receptor isoform X3 [Ooceraea biroi]|uniref:allatostatin-A receptor isoform X3 n=1 Tax=Ooceraea biroi TaxID=2015173 RepID=UPI0005BDBBD1|nr:allatostatin-A receptor isoform X3 [Ooceraea biroi]